MTLYQIYGLELLLDDTLLPEAARRGFARGCRRTREVDLIRFALGPDDRVLELEPAWG